MKKEKYSELSNDVLLKNITFYLKTKAICTFLLKDRKRKIDFSILIMKVVFLFNFFMS